MLVASDPCGTEPLSWRATTASVALSWPILLGFANADDGGKPGAMRRTRLGVDESVDLPVIGPALGMTDDHRRRPAICQHLGGDIAGMSARSQRMAILGTQSDAASDRDITRAGKQGCGRAHHQVGGEDGLS